MDKFQQILTIAGAALGILATATGFLIPLVKNRKARKALEAVNRITAQIQPFVVRAEKFVGYDGAAKKQYVMTALNGYAKQNGLSFDAEAVSEAVDRLVETTRRVNGTGSAAAAAGKAGTAESAPETCVAP